MYLDRPPPGGDDGLQVDSELAEPHRQLGYVPVHAGSDKPVVTEPPHGGPRKRRGELQPLCRRAHQGPGDGRAGPLEVHGHRRAGSLRRLARWQPEQKQDDNTIQHDRRRMFCGGECCKVASRFFKLGHGFHWTG